MRKNLNKILLIMLMTCLTADIFAEVKLRTEADVSVYTDSITGFNSLKRISKSFKRVDINDDNTPFLQSQINGRKNVWMSEIKDVSLISKSGKWVTEDKYKRSFKVFIDVNSGTLLKITSKYEGYDPNMLPEPNAIYAKKQLSGNGESYLGYPETPPKISLLDAIDSVRYGNPFLAKEIDALYIWYSHMGSEPRRVWVITLRGLPPIEVHPPPGIEGFVQPPVWQRNHTRNIIDADTGKPIFSTNDPHPEDPNKTTKFQGSDQKGQQILMGVEGSWQGPWQ